jgi:hypothetical protein
MAEAHMDLIDDILDLIVPVGLKLSPDGDRSSIQPGSNGITEKGNTSVHLYGSQKQARRSRRASLPTAITTIEYPSGHLMAGQLPFSLTVANGARHVPSTF